MMMKKNSEPYSRSYLADEIEAEDVEELYMNAHEKIREDPSFKPTEKKFTKEQYAAESKKIQTN